MAETKILKVFACYNCGETETITGIAVQDLIQRGYLEPGTPYALRREVTPLIEPKSAAFTVPVIIVSWDICAKCGTLYPTKVETMDAPIRVMPGKMPGFDLPPGFGKG